MKERLPRKTKIYRHHFWDFYHAQSANVQAKIDWVIALIRTLSIVPEKYLKHLEGSNGLYEIQVQLQKQYYEDKANGTLD